MSILETTSIDAGEGAPAPLARRAARRHGGLLPTGYGIIALTLLTMYYVVSGTTQIYTYNLFLLAVFGAVALNLLMGTAGLVSIGTAAFLAVGSFGSIVAQELNLPFPLDIVFAAIAAGVIGGIIGLPALRLRGLHLALATMAGFFVIIYLAHQYQNSSGAGGSAGFFITPLYTSKGLDGGQEYWAWTLLVLVALLLLGATRLVSERSGRAWRLIRDHEVVAHTMGIPVTRYKMLAFALTSAVIGFEGGLLVHFTGSASADNFSFELSVTYIAMVLIGGIDSMAGAVIGAGIVTALPVIVPEVVSKFMDEASAADKGPGIARIVYGLLVIIFITSSPHGLIGLIRDLRRRAGSAIASRRAPQPPTASRHSRGATA